LKKKIKRVLEGHVRSSTTILDKFPAAARFKGGSSSVGPISHFQKLSQTHIEPGAGV
jgi:hypothetical protein